MEDFDEIPVDAQFFNVLGGVNIQLKTEPDPLSVPSAPPPPPKKSQPRPPRLILPKPPPPPPQPPLPVPIRPSPGIPPQYRNMPITTFAQEMERNLHDIIYESIYLFQRDPLTYHPFYLRLYKYITIGQHLGYVSVDPQIVASIWLGFSTFADDQYQKMRNGREDEQLNFTGERSPYANYLLTGKVIIEGRELPQKRGKEERDKLVKQLEEKGNLLKIQWKVKKGRTFGGGGGLRADLALKLKFFEECKAVTFPGEVEEMNKVWEDFLEVKEGGKVTPKGKVDLVQATPPPTRQMRSAPNILKRKMAVVAAAAEGSSGKKSKLSGGARNVEEKEGPEEVDIKKEPEEEEKESRHALRRIMIKVIVVPPSSSKGSQGEGDANVLSPPPSPSSLPAAYSPPPSPPEACSPPASPLPSSRPLKKKPSTSKVASSSKMKRGLKKVKRVPRRKIGEELGKQLSVGLRALRKKKRVIFKRIMAIRGIDFKTRLIERQLKVEKLINQVKLELPDVKKNRMKKKKKELSGKGISKGKNAPATSTSKKGKASRGKPLKVKKTISKPTKVNKVKETKIVEKVNNKKVVAAPKKVVDKVVKEKKKSPLKKAKGGGKGRGRGKRKASSESEEDEEIPVKVQPVRRSARQPKLKFKSYGEGDDDEDN